MKEVKTAFDIPNCNVTPVNQRIFCVSYDASERKTEGGIIIPGVVQHSEAKQNQRVVRKRYFAVAVAEDVKVSGPKGKQLEKGHEIYPQMHPDAVEVEWPIIIDHTNGNCFTVLHESEIFAVAESGVLEEKPKKKK